MNIFITVGTTPFDTLIKYCDTSLDSSQYTVIAQISNLAIYQPLSFESFAYTEEIVNYYEWADVIISHAGAGTFYQLMELGKKVIFIPNVTLKDQHQDDICTYALQNNYAFSTKNYSEIPKLLDIIREYDFRPYRKDSQKIASFVFDRIKKE